MTHGDGINILFAVEQIIFLGEKKKAFHNEEVVFCSNKTAVIILRQSLDSNKRQTDGVKNRTGGPKKKKKEKKYTSDLTYAP